MCLICIEVAKRAMTAAEGRRALGEMRVKIGPEHAREVEEKLEEAEKAQREPSDPLA